MILSFYLQGLLLLTTVFYMTACHGTGILSKNPHINSSSCDNCHSAEPVLLLNFRSGKLLPKDAPKVKIMKYDLNKLCTRCHKKGGKDHAIGLEPEINQSSLPLDEEGKINCAITCHNVHADAAETAAGYLRQQERKLCLSCHDI